MAFLLHFPDGPSCMSFLHWRLGHFSGVSGIIPFPTILLILTMVVMLFFPSDPTLRLRRRLDLIPASVFNAREGKVIGFGLVCIFLSGRVLSSSGLLVRVRRLVEEW